MKQNQKWQNKYCVPRMFMTVSETADFLNYDRHYIVKLCDSGRLDHIRPAGKTGHRRISAKSIEKFLDFEILKSKKPESV
jgi:excisionase family DNA binding protein